MKVAVIGAGAIGGVVAGYLAGKKENVTVIARPEQVELISQKGLCIEGVRGKFSFDLRVDSCLKESADLVILATKTQDLEKAVSDNIVFLQDTAVVTTQNGVASEEIIRQCLPECRLFPSIVMFGATYLSPGKIVHNFEGNWIFGYMDDRQEGLLRKITKVTSRAFPSYVTDNITGMKWLKLFVNANNCLPAILGKSMQETFSDIAVCRISLCIWQEAWQIVRNAGIRLVSLPDFPVERVSGLVSMPLDKSAGIYSGIMTNLSKEPLYGSILQSIKRGRSSEIDYINGEFVRLAEKTSQDVPLNRRLVEMVHSVEKDKKFFSVEELISETDELERQ